jgi:hypothetical protein
VPLCVHVLRKDGFNGPIDIKLHSNHSGFKINGGEIPPGCDKTYITLETPQKALPKTISLRLQGIARINGRIVRRPAVPAEDMMQAFLYRHLVPSEELLIAVKKSPRTLKPFELLKPGPLTIKAGESARLTVKVPRQAAKRMKLELFEPHQGITITETAAISQGLAFTINTDRSLIKNTINENLIIEVFIEFTPRRQRKAASAKTRLISLGVLPAIPVTISKQPDLAAHAGS